MNTSKETNTSDITPDTATEDAKVWLTAEETAAILRVHVTTVHDMCRQGRLPAMKAGRDWRISADGLRRQGEIGNAYGKLIHAAAEASARKTVARVLTGLAEAINQESKRQDSRSGTRQ